MTKDARQDRLRMTVGAVVAIGLAAGLGIWVASRKADSPDPVAGSSPREVGSSHASDAASSEGALPLPASLLNRLDANPSQPVMASVPPVQPEDQSGKARIQLWLTSSTEPEVVAQYFLNGFDKLPPEDHALAASKLVVIISQEQQARMRQIMLDPDTSVEAKDIIYRDAVNRSDDLRLPMLLAVMQQPQHPNALEARTALIQAMGADYGTDYGLWQAKVSEELRRQDQPLAR